MKKFILQVCEIRVSAQMTDGIKLNIFGIIISSFSVKDKEKMSTFFEKTVLLANISIDIPVGMSLLTLNNVKINIINCYIH